MRIQISSDSTCDLSPALVEQYNIAIKPLYVTKGDCTYLDYVNITPEEIYAHVDNGGDICSTAAVNIGDYIDHFNELRKDCDAIIHICISADFSSCYQNACLAAADIDGV